MNESKLELLLEALKDMTKGTDVVHYTNFDGLCGILRDGILKGRNYSSKTREDTKEVATLRRSRDRFLQHKKENDPINYNSEIQELSENIGPFKIYLHSNRITAGVRDTRKAPIAEFYGVNKKFIEKNIKEVQEKLERIHITASSKEITALAKKETERLVKGKTLANIKSIRHSEAEPYANSFLDKLLVSKTPSAREELKFPVKFLILQFRYMIYSSSMGREAEERFSFKGEKNQGIPVDPLYMKIRITEKYIIDKITNNKEPAKVRELMSSFMKLKKDIIKYDKVFLKDSNFRAFVKELDLIIRNYS